MPRFPVKHQDLRSSTRVQYVVNLKSRLNAPDTPPARRGRCELQLRGGRHARVDVTCAQIFTGEASGGGTGERTEQEERREGGGRRATVGQGGKETRPYHPKGDEKTTDSGGEERADGAGGEE